MVAVGEPVRFVADPLQEPERTGFVREPDRNGAARAMDFFKLLGQSDDGEIPEDEPLQFMAGSAELSAATVHNDQIRKRAGPGFGKELNGVFLGKRRIQFRAGGEFADHRRVFRQKPTVPPPNNLGHTGEIVLTFDGRNPVPAVQ